MSEVTDSIRRGEGYDFEAAAADANGDAITLDGTWSASATFRRDHIEGPIIHTETLTITDGEAVASGIDTSDWPEGIVFYDIVLTDSSGDDTWSQPVKLTVLPRSTSAPV